MEKQLKHFHEFMNDVWQFYKQHYPPNNTESYWTVAVEDAKKLEEKYGDNKTMLEIIIDILEGFEREAMK